MQVKSAAGMDHPISHVAAAADLWFKGARARLPATNMHAGLRLLRPPDAAKQPICTPHAENWCRAAASLPPSKEQRTKMPVFLRIFAVAAAAVAFAAVLLTPEGAAYAIPGQPTPWGIGLQEAASPVMEQIEAFHAVVLWIITAITLFVLALLVIVMVKFNARANPTPSRTTHNTLIEVLWTVIPVVILVLIAVPSFRLLFLQLNTPPEDLVVKATGQVWSWRYSYPKYGDWELSSFPVDDKDLKEGQPRNLTVDEPLVVPVNKIVKVLVTGEDVIHAFAVPAFGIKIDAIPGRLNETWFKATKEGWFYGQCSELCGQGHAFMPIAVHVVSEDEFNAWIAEKKKTAAAPVNKSSDFAAVQPSSGGFRLQ
jgi:cytochrome c oxidase subunit II